MKISNTLNYIKQNIINNKFLYAAFLCFGLFAGSLIVDFSGMGRGKVSLGYLSGSAGSIFQAGSRTWVSYSNPIIEMTVLNELSCKSCDPSKEVESIKQNISPTIISKDLDISTEGGKTLIDLFQIKSIPAFILSKEIENIAGFNGIKHLLKKEGDYFLLNSAKAGIDPRKILNFPADSDAKVVIAEISDYQCPYCKKAALALDKALKDYSEKDIKIILKHFPLDFHEFAEEAALAAECARQQDLIYFKNINNDFFESQFNSDKEIRGIAKSIAGMDYKKWEFCYDNKNSLSIIKGDQEWAESIGISGTPAFIINGRFFSGALSEEKFREIIKEELDNKGS